MAERIGTSCELRPFTSFGQTWYDVYHDRVGEIYSGETYSNAKYKAENDIRCFEKPSPCGNLGDVDNDGFVTQEDALLVANHTVGNIQLTPEQLIRADVNGDGIVSSVDALFIAQYAAGTRSTFPACTSSILTSINITPASKTIGIDKTVQLSAVCKDQNNDVMTCPTLAWSSSNTLVATVSSTGLVTGLKEGTASITASAEGKTGTSVMTVSTTPPPEDKEGKGINPLLMLAIGVGFLYVILKKK